MKILTEASGSMVSGYLIKAIQESGHVSVASDVSRFNHGECLADEFIEFPYSNDENLWEIIDKELKNHKIDVVIPSFDETLMSWSEKKEYFKNKGIHVIISDVKTLEVFGDKYKAYQFCLDNGIPTPKTSLKQEYTLVKPRFGRGGSGVYVGDEPQDMDMMISQEYIEGKEFTVDCFFDSAGKGIYTIVRERLNIKDGKSTKGIVVRHNKIEDYVQKISERIEFLGAVNFQFIEKIDGSVSFIEVNPRIAGGMALGFAASENWISLMVENFINGKKVKPGSVKYGLKMMRYYAECYI